MNWLMWSLVQNKRDKMRPIFTTVWKKFSFVVELSLFVCCVNVFVLVYGCVCMFILKSSHQQKKKKKSRSWSDQCDSKESNFFSKIVISSSQAREARKVYHKVERFAAFRIEWPSCNGTEGSARLLEISTRKLFAVNGINFAVKQIKLSICPMSGQENVDAFGK